MSDISEIFDRDPLGLSQADLDAIVAYYRNARQQNLLGDIKAGSAKKMRKASGEKLSIDDLLS